MKPKSYGIIAIIHVPGVSCECDEAHFDGCARLATAQEIEDLHKSAWPPGWVPAESCFVCAIVKIDSERTGIEVLYHILPVPKLEPREDELQAMWNNAQRSIAEIERRTGHEQHK